MLAVARDSHTAEALEYLCQGYWPAIYAYARYRGYSSEDAEDLTQGFFARVLEKHYVEQADPERGKFRTFLITSFRNYMSNEWNRSRAKKRGGGQWLLSLDFDSAERQVRFEPAERVTPETLFERKWARTLLDRVQKRLEMEMRTAGQANRYDVLKGHLSGSHPEDGYREIARELELSEGAVRVAVHRMRRRFASLLREEVKDTVGDENAVTDEIRHLVHALGD